MSPFQSLASALATRGIIVSPDVLADAASSAGVVVTCSTARGVADHIARHAALSREVSP
jgi:hypothetical protein